MPSDITGTEVIQEDQRPGSAGVPVPQGPDLRQRDPGRRNQPHAAQDPGGPAGGDAGISGHRRRPAAPARPSRFSCWPRRTPSSRKEPIRCPRPNSTASCSTPTSIIPSEEEEFDIVRRTTADITATVTPTLSGAADSGVAADRPPRAGGRPRGPLRDEAVRLTGPAARGRRQEARSRRTCQFVRLRQLGRRAAGQPISGAGGEGPGRACTAASTPAGRHPGRGLARAPAPHRHELQRRGRRDQARRNHPPADRSGRGRRRRKLPPVFKKSE